MLPAFPLPARTAAASRFNKLLSLTVLVAACFAAPPALAVPMDGASITITSSFNGSASELRTVTVDLTSGSRELVDAGGFSWMIPGDHIDVSGGTLDRFRFEIFFSSDHSPLGTTPQAPLFDDDDYLDVTFQLPAGWTFDAAAITKAISVQASGVNHGNSLSMHIYGLGQMTGGSAAFSGTFEWLGIISDGPQASVPEGGATAGLLVAGLALIAFGRLRRK